MPDETTNTDTTASAPVPVEPVAAEPTIVAEPKPVAVAEPVIVVAPTEPVVETVVEPSVVAEQSVIAETPAAIESILAVDVPVESTVVEPVVAVEQPALVAQEPVAPQSGDFGLTPQSTPNEALKMETIPEFHPVEPVEPVMAVVPSTPESAQAPARPAPEPVKTPAQPYGFVVNLFAKGRATIQARKRKKLDRIMGLFTKQASIVNDDAEKLLHISDATACRYLGILEKENKIKQVGTAGRWVSYVKI